MNVYFYGSYDFDGSCRNPVAKDGCVAYIPVAGIPAVHAVMTPPWLGVRLLLIKSLYDEVVLLRLISRTACKWSVQTWPDVKKRYQFD